MKHMGFILLLIGLSITTVSCSKNAKKNPVKSSSNLRDDFDRNSQHDTDVITDSEYEANKHKPRLSTDEDIFLGNADERVIAYPHKTNSPSAKREQPRQAVKREQPQQVAKQAQQPRQAVKREQPQQAVKQAQQPQQAAKREQPQQKEQNNLYCKQNRPAYDSQSEAKESARTGYKDYVDVADDGAILDLRNQFDTEQNTTEKIRISKRVAESVQNLSVYIGKTFFRKRKKAIINFSFMSETRKKIVNIRVSKKLKDGKAEIKIFKSNKKIDFAINISCLNKDCTNQSVIISSSNCTSEQKPCSVYMVHKTQRAYISTPDSELSKYKASAASSYKEFMSLVEGTLANDPVCNLSDSKLQAAESINIRSFSTAYGPSRFVLEINTNDQRGVTLSGDLRGDYSTDLNISNIDLMDDSSYQQKDSYVEGYAALIEAAELVGVDSNQNLRLRLAFTEAPNKVATIDVMSTEKIEIKRAREGINITCRDKERTNLQTGKCCPFRQIWDPQKRSSKTGEKGKCVVDVTNIK